jgi:sugar phosphate isomerase/epimerase
MRLGGLGFYLAERAEDLAPLCAKLDKHGLSAIPAPTRLAAMDDEECNLFGEEARRLDLVVGEAGMWQNLMSLDDDLRDQRIEMTRTMLCKAELMDCRCVVTLVGSNDPSDFPLTPNREMFSDASKAEFREVVLRVLDGLDLEMTSYVIEPWFTTFFYRPETIAEFIASVDHPRFGVHLDLMNMVDWKSFYDTTTLVEQTFALLRDRVRSVHLKDIRWDYQHQGLKWDEVLIGDGVIDYEAYLRAIADELPEDMTCYCEHLPDEKSYAENFARVHARAEQAGVLFRPRSPEAIPTA